MRQFPPREPPPERRPGRFRRDMPRPEGAFERLLRRRPERDPAPLIIGGTIAFLALVIVVVLLFSSLFGGGGNGDGGFSDDETTIDIAPGIRGRVAETPPLPPGLTALSQFVEFEAEESVPVTIGLPLIGGTPEDPSGMGFYEHLDGRWQRIGDVSVREIEGRTVAEGDFEVVPQNLAVLRVLPQTYQVAGSLPQGATLHADARVNILNPRDYIPAGDGSVQGQATDVPRPEGTLVLPTIVGSGTDTAAVVDDILADESLRAQHVQQIASLVQNGNFDGIDLEYSAVDPDLAGEFTSFVKALAENLHGAGKRLSLTLPPPTQQRQAYQWEELGREVDMIRILPIADPIAYWETMPGAISRVVEDVESNKVMLVLNPYSIEGTGDVSRPIGYQQAMALAAEAAVREPPPDNIRPGNAVRIVARNLDESEGASPMRWDDEAAAVSFALGGTERRRIFVENKFSVAFKLEIVQAYRLAGVAVADASAESDVANVWPTVNNFVETATANLVRPNETNLAPSWQADAGDIGAGTGTTVTWTAPNAGTYNITLIVSDGERRFGRRLAVEVKPGEGTTPTPIITFPPESPTPVETPTPAPTSASPGATPGGLAVQVGKRAASSEEGPFVDPLTVELGGEDSVPVTFRIVIDNDSNVPVTIESVVDSMPGASCDAEGDTLAPDDGDRGEVVDTGDDAAVCTYTVDVSESVENQVVVTVTDEDGNSGTDRDTATVNVS
jgi:hypothetical protein